MAGRVVYVAPSQDFYLKAIITDDQTGSGAKVIAGIPVFSLSHGILEQVGEGFWSDLLAKGAKFLGKHLLHTGAQIVADKVRNPAETTRSILKRRLIEGGQNLLDSGYKEASSYLQRKQYGSGCPSSIRKRKIKATKTRRKPSRSTRKRVYKRKKKTYKNKVKTGKITKRKKRVKRSSPKRGSKVKQQYSRRGKRARRLSVKSLDRLLYGNKT